MIRASARISDYQVDGLAKSRSGHPQQHQGPAQFMPVPAVCKSLWTCAVEAAFEYCRIVWDIYPSGRLIRFHVLQLSVALFDRFYVPGLLASGWLLRARLFCGSLKIVESMCDCCLSQVSEFGSRAVGSWATAHQNLNHVSI